MLPRLGLSLYFNNVRSRSEGRQSRLTMLSLMLEVVTLASISARAAEKNLLARAVLILVSWSQYVKMYPRQDLVGHGWLPRIFSELQLFSLNSQISGLGPRQIL